MAMVLVGITIGSSLVMKRHIKMTSTLPRYLTKRKQADGLEHYRFNPLQKYIDIGIVKRMSLGSDKQRALQDAEEMNALIDE